MTPLLEAAMGVRCFTLPDFNSDLLGTFSGEIERPEDPLGTARKKCEVAMDLAHCDLAIASEGSFGPHPSLPFVYADDEIVLLLDRKNELEIFTRILSTETNFNAREVRSKDELKDFAYSVKFPSHGLIIRKAKDDLNGMKKGITDWKQLSECFSQFYLEQGSAYVETDMRAMYNPTRMTVIEAATKRLLDKVNSCCPSCGTPGLGITAIKEGLPCRLCSYPTRSTLSYLYECQRCDHVKIETFPNQKETEDPMYCDRCNP